MGYHCTACLQPITGIIYANGPNPICEWCYKTWWNRYVVELGRKGIMLGQPNGSMMCDDLPNKDRLMVLYRQWEKSALTPEDRKEMRRAILDGQRDPTDRPDQEEGA